MTPTACHSEMVGAQEDRGIHLLPPDGNIPLVPLDFFHLSYFFPMEFCPAKSCSIWMPRERSPQMGTRDMVLPPPAGDQQDRLCSYYLQTVDEVGGTFSAH